MNYLAFSPGRATMWPAHKWGDALTEVQGGNSETPVRSWMLPGKENRKRSQTKGSESKFHRGFSKGRREARGPWRNGSQPIQLPTQREGWIKTIQTFMVHFMHPFSWGVTTECAAQRRAPRMRKTWAPEPNVRPYRSEGCPGLRWGGDPVQTMAGGEIHPRKNWNCKLDLSWISDMFGHVSKQ